MKKYNLFYTFILLVITNAFAENFSVQVETREYSVSRNGVERVIENKLDNMDVYALAKDAKKLYRGHMLSWELLQQYSKNNGISELKKIIQEVAASLDLDEYLIAAIIKVESDFNQNALSSVGAQGLMQLMPETADELQVKDPYNPLENITAGSSYIKKLLKSFNGDLDLALASYNAGINNVKKYNGIPPFTETQNFVKKVKAYYELFSTNGY